MNKSQCVLRSTVAIVAAFSFVFLFAGGAYAASTIGTNMSTTGTFTQTVGSATAARFQNAAGTVTVLHVDTTNTRVGVGAAPRTTFEVQGTASASYFFTSNSLQVGGSTFATVSYSRFGTGATGHSLTAVDDVLFTGLVEFDDNAFFDAKVGIGGATNTVFEVQGTASASYLMTANSLQVGGVASVAYSRFGIGATGHSLAAVDDVLFAGLVEFDDNAFFDAKVGIGGATNTVFEVQGTASASYLMTANSLQVGGVASVAYSRFGIGATGHSLAAVDDVLFAGLVEFDDNAFFDQKVSVSSNFQTSGRVIAGNASHSFTGDLTVSSNLILGTAAASSSGGLYVAEFSTATVGTASFLFAGGGDSASTTGTCFQLKDNEGKWVYLSIDSAATPVLRLDYTQCH